MYGGDTVTIFGVGIANLSQQSAIDALLQYIDRKPVKSHAISIVNAHTLNLAYADPAFSETLRKSDLVLGDGTGVRWAAKMRGVKMKDNLVGTDLIPNLFTGDAARGHRYYLLGAEPDMIDEAAAYCRASFPDWIQAGYHHGYVESHELGDVIANINASRPDVLLVGMGNPLQEQWIRANLHALSVPVCIGVGGLFDHWGGRLTRAPLWVRRLGYEWLQILLQQPQKWRRYLLGNFAYLWRAIMTRASDTLLPGARDERAR